MSSSAKSISVLFLIVLLSSCGGSDDASQKEKELALKEKEIELREREAKLESTKAPQELQAHHDDHHGEPEVKSEVDLKRELLKTECSNPTKYLVGDLKMTAVYKNAISLKVKAVKIKGYIRNSATIATFKNAKVKITFKAKTGAIIKSAEFDALDYFKPGKGTFVTHEIALTNDQYNDIKNWYVDIIKAECY